MATNPKIMASFSFLDFSRETASMQVHVDEGATTVNSALTGTTGTTIGDIYGVLTAMCYADTIISRGVTGVNRLGATAPADADAQREKKWLVSYHDTVTFARYNFEIPCARTDTEAWFNSGSDELNLANTTVANWVTIFEANVVSPDYNPISIDSIRFVGRNS